MACRFKAVPGDPVPSVPEACQLGHGHVATFTSDSVVCSCRQKEQMNHVRVILLKGSYVRDCVSSEEQCTQQ